MIEEFVLHVGPPKTGSTAIQNALGFHRQELLAAGVYTPDQVNHTCLLRYLDLRKRIQANDDSEMARLDEVLSSGGKPSFDGQRYNKVIVSCEFLTGLQKDALEKLAKYLGRHVRDIRVLGYLRKPADIHVSWIQELLKNGVPYKTSAAKFGLNYGKIYEKYSEAFPNSVEMRAFSPADRKNWDAVTDFFEAAGVKVSGERDQTRSNSSMSLEAGLLLDALSEYRFSPPIRREINAKALKIRGRKFAIGQADLDAIDSKFEGNTTWCRDALGIEFNPSQRAGINWEHEKQAVMEVAEIKEVFDWARAQCETS